MANEVELVKQMFDDLVKSRFIEMFGNPLNQTSEYEYVPIRSFSKCVAGATPSTLVDEYWNDGTIPWLSSGEVNQGRIYSTEKKITQKGYDNCSTHIVPVHTVLIALAGQGKTRGTVAVTEIELCTNQSICSIITDKTIEADYLYQALKIQYDRIRSMSNGDGGRGGLNLEIVGKITVPKPPIELQQQFADFVKQVDKSKVIFEQEVARYDQLTKSRFIEMFGDLQHNPYRWPIKTIGDLATDIKYGTSKPAIKGGKYTYLRMSNISEEGKLDLSETKTIDIDDDEFEKCCVKYGDLMFNRTNSGDKVGKTCVFDNKTPMVIAGYIIRVRFNSEVTSKYVSSVFNSQYGKNWMHKLAKNSVCQSNINSQQLKSIEIPVPPINLQTEYEDFLEQVDKSKSELIKTVCTICKNLST